MADIGKVRDALHAEKSELDAQFLQKYFKTAAGEYGEGDRFIGVRVPKIRMIAKQFRSLLLAEVSTLLQSPIHEERLLALIILTLKFDKATSTEQQQIYQIYLANTAHINNWDLVDTSVYKIVGSYLCDKPRTQLYEWVVSNNMWQRRMAIIATLAFIKRNEFKDTFQLAETLLNDNHDLLHKAVGWMLREVGNRDLTAEQGFLNQHYRTMPRTMLRYAIEKFPEPLRKAYLNGEIA